MDLLLRGPLFHEQDGEGALNLGHTWFCWSVVNVLGFDLWDLQWDATATSRLISHKDQGRVAIFTTRQ